MNDDMNPKKLPSMDETREMAAKLIAAPTLKTPDRSAYRKKGPHPKKAKDVEPWLNKLIDMMENE